MPEKSIPDALNRHLSAHSHDDAPGVADYVERGTALVTPEAILQDCPRPVPAVKPKGSGISLLQAMRQSG